MRRDGFLLSDKEFISFLESLVPAQVHSSKKLINTDVKSKISNYRQTNIVETPVFFKNDRILMYKNSNNVIHGRVLERAIEGYCNGCSHSPHPVCVFFKEKLVLIRNSSRKVIFTRNRSNGEDSYAKE